ncbi:hypothetical protein FBEOM_4044 [Fusarium beomiforme]|uniref:Uncharacterized protein n=1 Tax=Fusarium beomiforme TaxID=44412 RepID=A0A9P5ANS6_9HYPO|nr:hypothetical protein FBEOM_4044 [Fusarium beomiforme]
MPPYAAELEDWWLGAGYEALKHLVNKESEEINPRQCGFAQQIQARLLTFDADETIQASLRTTWPAIRAARGVDYNANSRKNSKYIASNIFRKPKDGGIDFERAMDGLGYLDAIEIRRLRLLEATHAAMETASPTDSQIQMLQELDRTSSSHFRLLHAGFRTCILIEELTKDANHRKEVPQIMGILNALVPSEVFLKDEDDIDPTPHSRSLCDSVRFSVFEHLMSDDPFSHQRQEIIQMKLYGWCDAPEYPRARDAMVRYSEEFKKLEDICLKIMNDLERRSASAFSYHAIYVEPPTLSGTCSPYSSDFPPDAVNGGSTIFTPPTLNDSQDSTPTAPMIPLVPLSSLPLLKGMPGRELSPAKTDGALFAQDLSAPPILSYPDNLSKTEFFQHPFARDLDIDDEGSDMLPIPPLPHIPERLKAHLTPNVLDKIKKRMRYQTDRSERTDPSDTPFQALNQHLGTSTTRKSSDRKRCSSLKENISNPVSIIGPVPESLRIEGNRCETPNPFSSPSQSPMSPQRQNTVGEGTLRPLHRRGESVKLGFKLTTPRLSPMEYCRMYLVEKSLSDCEDRRCELPSPDKHWFWTNYYKQFIVIPQIPRTIRRDSWPMPTGANGDGFAIDTDATDSDMESVLTIRPGTGSNGPMRLSLHFCGEPIILPTFMDTLRFSLSGAQNQDSLESDEEARDDRIDGVPKDEELALPRRVSAGGESEDWRPMSEYEPDENDEVSSGITPVEARGSNGSIQCLDETIREMGTPSHSTPVDDTDIRQNQQTSSRPDPGSPSIHKSVRRQCLPGNSDQAYVQNNSDSDGFQLSRQLSRICKEDLSVFDFATPRLRGKTVGDTPQSLATTDKRSPLACFPIAVQPIYRLTPGTLTKRVVGDSGGKLLSEDTRQARLIPSPGNKHHQGLSADLWEADAESMISDLQPEPFHINRRQHRANTDQSDRRWTGMFDRGNADAPTTLEMLRMSPRTEQEGDLDLEAVDDDYYSSTEGDRTPRVSEHQGQCIMLTTPGPRGLQRSASTIITPTQSARRLEHKPSFNLEAIGQSGLTPEHYRESISKETFPRSGMMLNLQNTHGRLRCPLQELDGPQLSQNFKDRTAKARRLPEPPNPGRSERGSTAKEWMRAITPRKARTMSRQIGRSEKHSEASSVEDWRKNLFQPSDTSEVGDVQCSISTTQDFSQTHRLQKPPPQSTLTPSSTYRPPDQRHDRSIRASSPLPLGNEVVVPDHRTPSPTASQNPASSRTPSSSIGGLFRKRIHPDCHIPTTPRTPAQPKLAWSPFANYEPEPPCASPWISGNGEGEREKEERAAYFREKVEREFQIRQSPKRLDRKNSVGSMANGDSVVQDNLTANNRVSKESLIPWKQFLKDAPEPLFSSPLPPVPPLPSDSQLNLALDRRLQTQTPSRVTSRIEATSASTYRDKKPQGLTVETRKLRKAMREGAQTPSRNTSMTPASGTSFKSAFRFDGRRMSFGRQAAERKI